MSIARKRTTVLVGVSLLLLAAVATAMLVRRQGIEHWPLSEAAPANYDDSPITERMPWILVDPIEGPLSIDRIVDHTAAACDVDQTGLVDDETFLRRVTVDLIGRIPTLDEYDKFMDLPADERRAAAVDQLLNRPRFNDRWAVFFGDMFRVRADANGGRQLARFIRHSLRERVAYDQMVREMLTAIGGSGANPAVGFITAEDAEPLELAGVVTQTLMGVRMQCAQCHDHPFDDWTRKEYYSIAAYFSHTGLRDRRRPFRVLQVTSVNQPRVMWPPTPGIKTMPQKPMQAGWPFDLRIADESLMRSALKRKESKEAKAHPQIDDDLFDTSDSSSLGSTIDLDMRKSSDALARKAADYRPNPMREKLADRLVNPSNPYFAWNLVNRVWAELMGTGVVEPIDDFRGDNPPSHPQLLDYLATEFIGADYDLRSLIRRIVLSDAYRREQMTGTPAQQRKMAERLFAAAPLRRMIAEVLYDSLITAGRLDNRPKHHQRDYLIKREFRIATPKNLEEVNEKLARRLEKELELVGPQDRTYNAEGDFFDRIFEDQKDPLSDLRLLAIGATELIPAEIIERARERLEAQFDTMIEYEYKTITREIDERPRFRPAMRMASPAPSEHFLRQFGQTSRVLLGEERSNAPSMRQALILMNGQLANEAAKVGTLEPIYSYLQSDNGLDRAIRIAYAECLTRQPTEDEITFAKEVIGSAVDRISGMADLRWALLNCHEFRYLR